MSEKRLKDDINDVRSEHQEGTDGVLQAPSPLLLAVGQRIALLADQVGNRRKLAQLAGISEGHLYRYIRGASKATIEPIMAIAKATGVSLDWLLQGEGSAQSIVRWHMPPEVSTVGGEALAVNEFCCVPKARAQLASEEGGLLFEEATDHALAFRTQWLAHFGSAHALVLLDIHGESMEPTLRDGDIVLVQTERQHVAGEGLYAFATDARVQVKRLQPLVGQKMRIISDHMDQHRFPPFEVDVHADHIRIIGQVMWVGRDLS